MRRDGAAFLLLVDQQSDLAVSAIGAISRNDDVFAGQANPLIVVLYRENIKPTTSSG
jgi:hypothetical protein